MNEEYREKYHHYKSLYLNLLGQVGGGLLELLKEARRRQNQFREDLRESQSRLNSLKTKLRSGKIRDRDEQREQRDLRREVSLLEKETRDLLDKFAKSRREVTTLQRQFDLGRMERAAIDDKKDIASHQREQRSELIGKMKEERLSVERDEQSARLLREKEALQQEEILEKQRQREELLRRDQHREEERLRRRLGNRSPTDLKCYCPIWHDNDQKCDRHVSELIDDEEVRSGGTTYFCPVCLLARKLVKYHVTPEIRRLLEHLILDEVEVLFYPETSVIYADVMSGLYHLDPDFDWEGAARQFRELTGVGEELIDEDVDFSGNWPPGDEERLDRLPKTERHPDRLPPPRPRPLPVEEKPPTKKWSDVIRAQTTGWRPSLSVSHRPPPPPDLSPDSSAVASTGRAAPYRPADSSSHSSVAAVSKKPFLGRPFLRDGETVWFEPVVRDGETVWEPIPTDGSSSAAVTGASSWRAAATGTSDRRPTNISDRTDMLQSLQKKRTEGQELIARLRSLEDQLNQARAELKEKRGPKQKEFLAVKKLEEQREKLRGDLRSNREQVDELQRQFDR
jgi:hypothetical protein